MLGENLEEVLKDRRIQTLRILQVCLSKSWGGLEMAAFEFARDYSKRGIFVRTICPSASPLHERLLENSLPATALNAKRYFDPSAIRAIRNAVVKDGSDCVILQQLRDIWHVSPALRGHLKTLPLVGFGHIFLSHAKQDPLHRWLYKRVDSIICLTDSQKKNFLELLPLESRKIQIIPNGVDLTIFSPTKRSEHVRHSLGANPNDILIGVIGRLDPMKGQVELVEAIRLLREQGIDCKLAVVGEDTLNTTGTRHRLEKIIEQHNLQNHVRLAGFRKDVPEVIASFDVLVMPSWAETFGRVLIEAMAAQIPVVATAAGGVADIVEADVDGLLVPPQDPIRLAHALKDLVLQPSLRKRLTESAYKKVKAKYDSRKVQNDLDEILLQGIRTRKPGIASI